MLEFNSKANSNPTTKRLKEADCLSPNTRHLLKAFMKSSKLNPSQQKHLDDMIRLNGSLPSSPSTLSSHKTLDKMQFIKKSPLKVPFQNKPHLRTLDTIISNGSFEISPYHPPFKKDLSTEKARLQSIMAGEGSNEESLPKSNPTPSNVPLDEFQMLLQEIEERKEWLDDMIQLGKGDAFKNQIHTEIALRVQRMKEIDKELSKK